MTCMDCDDGVKGTSLKGRLLFCDCRRGLERQIEELTQEVHVLVSTACSDGVQMLAEREGHVRALTRKVEELQQTAVDVAGVLRSVESICGQAEYGEAGDERPGVAIGRYELAQRVLREIRTATALDGVVNNIRQQIAESNKAKLTAALRESMERLRTDGLITGSKTGEWHMPDGSVIRNLTATDEGDGKISIDYDVTPPMPAYRIRVTPKGPDHG